MFGLPISLLLSDWDLIRASDSEKNLPVRWKVATVPIFPWTRRASQGRSVCALNRSTPRWEISRHRSR